MKILKNHGLNNGLFVERYVKVTDHRDITENIDVLHIEIAISTLN